MGDKENGSPINSIHVIIPLQTIGINFSMHCSLKVSRCFLSMSVVTLEWLLLACCLALSTTHRLLLWMLEERSLLKGQ